MAMPALHRAPRTTSEVCQWIALLLARPKPVAVIWALCDLI